MNHVVVLVGGRNAGKSSILRSLCCVELGESLVKAKQKIYLNFKDKRLLVFIMSSSPQEKLKKLDFCQFEKVIKTLKDFINSRQRRAGSETEFMLLIAFTFEVNRAGELGENCIIKPLDFLKGLPDYKVHVVHIVKRDDIPSASRINDFIAQNMNIELTLESEETAKGRQDENARKLKDFLGQL